MHNISKHHLLITGTGRAGTSFLVRILDALGLETHFSRFGEHSSWDESANAGAENLPLPVLDPKLPYVVKSPWAGEFIDQILSDRNLILDAVVIPLRDIEDAASSRVIVELRDVIEHDEIATHLDSPWSHRGKTPGGVIYSLHPLDQKRILAVGFHHLVERLTAAEVPIIFLHFPRLIGDADYLYERLLPVLRHPVDRESFRSAHEKIAKLDQIRVNAASRDSEIERLERVALVREIERLRERLVSAEHDGKILRERLMFVESDEADQRDRLALAESEVATLREQLATAEGKAEALRERASVIETSRMWRALAPLRRALNWIRQG
jgi:hypothetical protein